MKIIFLLFLFFSLQLKANQCERLFEAGYQYYENYDREYSIILSPTEENIKDIEPNTHGLLLDEKIKPGDQVYIEFIVPLDPERPTTTSGTSGVILGSKFLTNDKGHLNLHYYILTRTKGHLISFTQSMISFEYSHLVKRKNKRILN